MLYVVVSRLIKYTAFNFWIIASQFRIITNSTIIYNFLEFILSLRINQYGNSYSLYLEISPCARRANCSAVILRFHDIRKVKFDT